MTEYFLISLLRMNFLFWLLISILNSLEVSTITRIILLYNIRSSVLIIIQKQQELKYSRIFSRPYPENNFGKILKNKYINIFLLIETNIILTNIIKCLISIITCIKCFVI